jgi:GWxTD domain-containing protein
MKTAFKGISTLLALITLLLLIAFLSALNAYAFQFPNDRSQYYDYGTRFYAETFVMPAQSPDSVNVVVMFRIANSLLPFAVYNKSPELYVAYPQVEVELKDASNIIRKRLRWRDTILVNDYDKIKAKEDYNFGWLSSVIFAGSYALSIELSNENDNTIKKIQIPNVSLNLGSKDSIISSPLFADEESIHGKRYFKAYVLGGNISFNCIKPTVLLYVKSKNEAANYSWSIEKKPAKDAEAIWNDTVVITGSVITSSNSELKYIIQDKEAIFEETTKTSSNPNNVDLLVIELPASRLVPGNYSMKLNQSGTNDTLEFQFNVVWEDMPLSLRKPDYAASLMYYILDDDEYKYITSGNNKAVFRKILDYWKKRDPTAFTTYNEAMAEYFRRIDYSFFNFQTFTDKDGARTDRGKIYILNGPPDDIEQTFSGSSQIEIWTYKKLKKRYRFETVSVDYIRLVSVEDIKL